MNTQFRHIEGAHHKLWQIIIIIIWFIVNQYFSYCQWVTNHNSIYQGDLSKPAKLVPIKDPNFGTKIIRLTDAVKDGFAGIVPEYSKRQAWNADESLMMLHTCDGQTLLYDGQNYNFIKTLNNVVGEDIFWHPTNPALIFYCPDSILYSYNVNTDENKIIHVFPDYTWTNTRGEGNLSLDGTYWAFVGQEYDFQKGTTFKDIVVFDIVNAQILKIMTLPSSVGDAFDWVSISPLGNYVVIDYATEITGRYNGIEVYDRNFNILWQKPLGTGHSDLTVDDNGDEILVMGVYDANENVNNIIKYRLSDGAVTKLFSHSWDLFNHISCRNKDGAGWCYVSTYDGVGRLTDSEQDWLPFEDEIFALKLDGSGEVRRLAHHRTRRFSPSTPDADHSVYFAEPHATVSRKADRVLFGSNWRENIDKAESLDAYVVDYSDFVEVNDSPMINELNLSNYPNPFDKTTIISFEIPNTEFIRLTLNDIFGNEIQEIINKELEQGKHSFICNSKNLPAGFYQIILRTPKTIVTRRTIVIK